MKNAYGTVKRARRRYQHTYIQYIHVILIILNNMNTWIVVFVPPLNVLSCFKYITRPRDELWLMIVQDSINFESQYGKFPYNVYENPSPVASKRRENNVGIVYQLLWLTVAQLLNHVPWGTNNSIFNSISMIFGNDDQANYNFNPVVIQIPKLLV